MNLARGLYEEIFILMLKAYGSNAVMSLRMARQTAQKYFYDSSGYLSGVPYTCLEFDILVWSLIYLSGF